MQWEIQAENGHVMANMQSLHLSPLQNKSKHWNVI